LKKETFFGIFAGLTTTHKPRKVKMESTTKGNETGEIINVGNLLSFLMQLKDKRKRRGIRYRLEVILLLFIFGKLCGQNKVYGMADWLKQNQTYLVEALKLKYPRLPHHSTYRRILGKVVDGEEMERLVGQYFAQTPVEGQRVVIAIDGKTVRGTITREDPFGLHLLAAYLPGEGLVLLQMVVEKEKENEIVVAPKLLGCLDLHRRVVIGDAMQTQRALSVQIVEAGGEFVWIVKDNQPATRQAIEQLFAPEKPIKGVGCPPMDFQSAKSCNKQAGRLEQRTITVSSMLNDYLDWPQLGQVFKLERRFTTLATGEVSQEVQYGLTSLTREEASPQQLLDIVRSEWGIENGLHYRRDVTFQEDQTRMTHKPFARVMTIINNLVIGLINRQGFTNHAHARRVFNADHAKALALLL
jgi:predicted transposase YbfD/YdcC